MNILLPIYISFIAGVFFLVLPNIKPFIKVVSPLIGILNFILSIIIFTNQFIPSYISGFLLTDLLSRFIYLGVGFFGFIISLYAVGHIEEDVLGKFFAYFFLTLGAAFGVAVADNLIILLVLWGLLGMTLYLLIQLGHDGANEAAVKSLIIIGASDCFLILGVGILWYLTNTIKMSEMSLLPTSIPIIAFAFICFIIAGFTKAGNMPFHSWIPPCANSAPISVTAYLPASLDKLLGIYLIARSVISIFKVSPGLSMTMMLFGAGTIIFAVFMALIQHSGRKLLAYCAVSQVGYMVLGLGTLNPIGICGGLFHMMNHAIYKSCLFLGLGDVEKRTGTDNLDELGGLAGQKPFALFSMLVASLAISGIPPLNGFFSKWMVYQGVVETFKVRNSFVPAICLIAALFGSALTLASFVKIIHSIFLTRASNKGTNDKTQNVKAKESSLLLVLPQIILAILCIGIGVFAYSVIVNPFFQRLLPFDEIGMWEPGLATILLIAGIIFGLLIYGVSRVKVREVKGFIGGEPISGEMKVSGTGFYLTIREIPFLGKIYGYAEKGVFDIYVQGKNFVFFWTNKLKLLASGVLPAYLLWCFAGIVILFFILMK